MRPRRVSSGVRSVSDSSVSANAVLGKASTGNADSGEISVNAQSADSAFVNGSLGPISIVGLVGARVTR